MLHRALAVRAFGRIAAAAWQLGNWPRADQEVVYVMQYPSTTSTGSTPSTALLELAQRLRNLRQEQWPDVRLTQDALARALGGVAAATISSWESFTAPKLPPPDRMTAYAQFFATRRSVETAEPKILPLESFTEDEETVYRDLEAELLGLRDAAASKPSRGAMGAVRKSWRFLDTGPVTLVCAQLPEGETASLADPKHPNYTELLSFADLDSLVELWGHIRAENPTMDVFYKAAPQVTADDLSGHVILLGGIAWNDVTKRLSAMTRLPVRQVEDDSVKTGEIFVADVDGEEQRFLPVWGKAENANPDTENIKSDPENTNPEAENTNLVEDVGFLARVANPLNSGRTLTICNGIHSRGVFGAVRSLTDARLRDGNERYISANFGSANSFVILMRVPVIERKTMTPDFNNPDGILYRWPQGAGK
jgi:Helix-turn-helix domain